MLIRVVEDEAVWIGRILVRQLPGHWNEETFKFWWPRFSAKERDLYTVAETHNLITTAGRTQVLTYIGAATSGTAPFAQYLAVGNFPINQVFPGDASVQGEFARQAPSVTIVTGNTVDISTFFGASQGNGTYTNCGIFGVNAVSSVGGAGTLLTHAVMSGFVKSNPATITVDYLITLT